MKRIAPFTSPNAADRELLNHLNELVDACNRQGALVGDQYISVKQSGAGTAVGLNIDRINAAIPKLRIKNWYKILTNETGGAYTVRFQLWNATTHVLDDTAATGAEYNVTAYDCLARDYAVADTIVPGWHVYSADADRLVIDVSGGQGTAGTPQVILPAAFETEDAQTDTFDRDNPAAGKDGVEVRIQTRMAYDDAATQILYAYYRTFTYDSTGALKTISAETRVEIDAPGACP